MNFLLRADWIYRPIILLHAFCLKALLKQKLQNVGFYKKSNFVRNCYFLVDFKMHWIIFPLFLKPECALVINNLGSIRVLKTLSYSVLFYSNFNLQILIVLIHEFHALQLFFK